MKATYNKPKVTKFTTSHRKERGAYHFNSYIVIGLTASLMDTMDAKCPTRRAREFIALRLYSTDARTTACVWVSGEGRGSGSAGGYGYHRPSAAAQDALNAAGFTLDVNIDGRGDSAIEDALLACAEALGVESPSLVIAHP